MKFQHVFQLVCITFLLVVSGKCQDLDLHATPALDTLHMNPIYR